MGRVSNFSGALIWSIVLLGLSITAVIFGAELLKNSAQQQLPVLDSEKTELQQQIAAFLPQVPGLVACQQILLDAVDFLNNCTAMAYAACGQNSELIETQKELLVSLGNDTIIELNQTLYKTINESCSTILQFQDEIAYVSNNQTHAIAQTIRSGTFNAYVLGTIPSFVSSTYEIKEITIASLRLRYAVLKKWPSSVQVNASVTDGTILYDSFDPPIQNDFGSTCDYSRPFITEQTNIIYFPVSGSIMAQYVWTCPGELMLQWTGTTTINELINQNEDLIILATIV